MNSKHDFFVIASWLLLFSLGAILVLSGCWPGGPLAAPEKLIIFSSSDFPVIDELVTLFNQERGYAVELRDRGLWDWFYDIQAEEPVFDAVLTNNSAWITMADEKLDQFTDQYRIAFSPLVIGIKPMALKKLGLERGITGMDHLVKAIAANDLSFAMASGSKSHSGILAFLEILAGFNYPKLEVEPGVLDKPQVRKLLTRFFQNHQLSGLGSLWVKEDFFRLYNILDMMINYEAYLIQTNQELVKFGKPALKIIYLNSSFSFDGPVLAFNKRTDEAKQKIYSEFVAFLDSDKAKAMLAQAGFRTGNPDKRLPLTPSTMEPSWLVSPYMPPRPKSWPGFELLTQYLTVYQEELRKPLFQIMALDFSGSMEGENQEKLFSALKKLCQKEELGKYFLQYSPQDRFFVLPFHHDLIWDQPMEVWLNSPDSTDEVCRRLTSIVSGGGTDIYKPLIEAMEFYYTTVDQPRAYHPSIVLLTDGTSNADRLSLIDVKRYWRQSNHGLVPPLIFPILYGTASLYQLSEIAEFANTRVVDGRSDLSQGLSWARND